MKTPNPKPIARVVRVVSRGTGRVTVGFLWNKKFYPFTPDWPISRVQEICDRIIAGEPQYERWEEARYLFTYRAVTKKERENDAISIPSL
jgi:hypothetical protein